MVSFQTYIMCHCIALDVLMTLKMDDEVWNGSKPKIPISARKRSGTKIAAKATSKYTPCGIFLRVQYWCQVSITLSSLNFASI